MMGLRPAQPAAKPKSSKKAAKDGDSSDEEIKRMTAQTKKYMTNHIKKGVPQNQKVFRKPNNQPIPPGYICHRCQQKGHLISDCPTNGMPEFDIVRPAKGVPKNLKLEDLPEQVEAKFVNTLINDEITYVDTNILVKSTNQNTKLEKSIAPEYECRICNEIYTDPQIVP